MTTDEVRTLGGTPGGGGHGHLQNMRPQMVNQNTPQVVNQTGQQVIQYIPQSPQPTGNIITIMPKVHYIMQSLYCTTITNNFLL